MVPLYSSLGAKCVFQFSAAVWDGVAPLVMWDGVAPLVISDASLYCIFSLEGLNELPMGREQTSLHGLCCVRKCSGSMAGTSPSTTL